MASYNKVILVGNLTRDPQMSYLPSQTPVAEFGMAMNHRWRSADGQQREEVCFIDCRLYGKSAETFCKYMAKGRPVLVEGRLQFDTWEGKDGAKHSKHRVMVDRFQFLGGGQPGQGGPGGAPGAARPAPQRQAAPAADAGGYDEPPPADEPPAGGDEIPF